ncbi:CMRF35-like molecule 5 [Clarias gariepinus]|uniref:CMRF35-like molecule 5 n=1 Tax=Clarias gariepinus TaxID=13013 RepID=UPI00234C3AD2|nr:CMRF35-like molecule 5 [Clarias gariepinus]
MEMVLIFTFCLILAGTDAVTTVTGYRGRSVQIKCNYTSGYEEKTKYLCRGRCSVVAIKDIPVDSKSPAKDSRFSLYDDTTAKVFTVTITDLRPEDEGTYWCGIEKTWRDNYTKILLLVKTDDPSISTVSHTTHSTSTHSMSTSVHAERTHSLSGMNFFIFLFVITAVSVVLVLLLVALLFATVLQRKKIKGSSPVQPVESYSNFQVVPCPDYDYDEIKDNKSISNIIYSTAPPPLNPSEIYSNTGLPTVPFDDPETVYTTVDHPSDPPDQDFYSTAQFPPVPSSVSAASPSVVESGEHLTYAALDLDTSSGAAPTVIYKHENNSSEYATVT